MSLPPILILSFNRPGYLARVCRSLRAQQGVAIVERDVHLLQDGAVSAESGVRYAADSDISAAIAEFRSAFPGGRLHIAPGNLGIAANVARAERLAFEALGAEVAYFFEDDLELGPHYLAALEGIRARAGELPELGYFAAYGDHRRREPPDPRRPQLIPLEHNWGFGLTRRCWAALRPWLAGFEEAWSRCDYVHRPHYPIVALYRDKPVASLASSQDAAKATACADLGFARVNTDASYARYIGEWGVHFSPERFAELGYDRMVVAETAPEEWPAIEPALLAGFAARARAEGVRIREQELEKRLALLAETARDGERAASAEEITELFALLLDRLPSAQDLAHHAGSSLRRIRMDLLSRPEIWAKNRILPRLRAMEPRG